MGQTVSPVTIIGYSGAISTSFTTLWDEGAAYTFLAADMATPTISSNSANDTSAGTGARTIRIWGVSLAGVASTEDLTLNGTTGVALVNTYETITLMRVLTAGSGGVAAGSIFVGTGSLTAGKPAVVHARLQAGRNQSTSAIYHVPAATYLYITDMQVCGRSVTAGGHEFAINTSVDGGLAFNQYVGTFQNIAPFNMPKGTPLVFAPKTQLKVDILASAGTGPASVWMQGYSISSSVGAPAVTIP